MKMSPVSQGVAKGSFVSLHLDFAMHIFQKFISQARTAVGSKSKVFGLAQPASLFRSLTPRPRPLTLLSLLLLPSVHATHKRKTQAVAAAAIHQRVAEHVACVNLNAVREGREREREEDARKHES